MRPKLLLLLLVAAVHITMGIKWDSVIGACNATFKEYIPEFDETPWSCKTRCGETYTQQPCACDIRCQIYTDCCDDFVTYCSHVAIVTTMNTPLEALLQEKERESFVERSALKDTFNVTHSITDKVNDYETDIFHSSSTTKPFRFSSRADQDKATHQPQSRLAVDERTTNVTLHQGITDEMEGKASVSSDSKQSALFFDTHVSASSSRNAHTSTLTDLKSLVGKVQCRHRSFLISECPDPAAPFPKSPVVYGSKVIQENEVVSRCNTPLDQEERIDLIQYLPVTDAATGMHLANVYCLLCNGGKVENAISWNIGFILHTKDMRRIQSPKNITSFLLLVRGQQIPSISIPPFFILPRRCLGLSSTLKYPQTCGCPHLVYLCEMGAPSFVNLNSKPFRNFACLLCFLIAQEKRPAPEEVKKPGIEALVTMKNRFQFSVTVNLKSNPARNDALSLQMVASVKTVLDWANMTCTFATVAGGNNSHMKMKSNTADLQKPTTNKSSVVNTDTGNDNPNQPVSPMHTTNSHMSNRTIETEPKQEKPTDKKDMMSEICRSNCAEGTLTLEGECRSDLRTCMVNIVIACNHSFYPGAGEKTIQSNVLATIKQHLQYILDIDEFTANGKLEINHVSATYSQDYCFLNATIYLIGSCAKSRSFQEIFLNTTFNYLIVELQDYLGNATKTLHVCGNYVAFMKFKTYWILGDFCMLSTIYQQPLRAPNKGQGGMRAVVQYHGYAMVLAVVVAVLSTD